MMRKRLFKALLFVALFLLCITFPIQAEEPSLRLTQKGEKSESLIVEFKHGLFSVHAKEIPLGKVIAEIEKQSGLSISFPESLRSKPITVDFSGLDIIQSLSRITNVAGLGGYGISYKPGNIPGKIGQLVVNKAGLVGKGEESVIQQKIDPDSQQGKGQAKEATPLQKKPKIIEKEPYFDKKLNRYVEVAKGEVFLRFPKGVTKEQIEKFHKEKGTQTIKGYEKINAVRLKIPATETVQEFIEKHSIDPKQAYIEPVFLASQQAVKVNDPSFMQQWAIPKIQADKAWEINNGSPDIIVAVIDTGIDVIHPDIKNKVVQGVDLVNGGSNGIDDNGHGTHVAGIIAAESNNSIGIAGISWKSRLMPVKVLTALGEGTYADLIEGIVYAVDNGAKVLNLSLGGYSYSQILGDAIQYAHSNRSVIVAAGGNENTNEQLYPAAYPNVIGVSATDPSDIRWSSANFGSYIKLSAPGIGILSTQNSNGYGEATGTSASAAHVSGVAALILSKNPDFSNTQVENILYQTADDLGDKGWDNNYGFGRVNALKAIEKAGIEVHDVAVTGIIIEPETFKVGEATKIIVTVENQGTFVEKNLPISVSVNGVTLGDARVIQQLHPEERIELSVRWLPDIAGETKITAEVALITDADQSDNTLTRNGYYHEKDGIATIKFAIKTHRWITEQAVKFLKGKVDTAITDELNLYLGELKDGAEHEDCSKVNIPLCSPQPAICSVKYDVDYRWLNHFYRPIDKLGYYDDLGFTRHENALQWGGVDGNNNPTNSYDWNDALTAYGADVNSKKAAYFALGHVLHLLEDMSLPEHTHLEAHVSECVLNTDGYEEYTKNHTYSDTVASLPQPKPTDDYMQFEFVTIADYFINMANRSYYRNRFQGTLTSSPIDGTVGSGKLKLMFPSLKYRTGWFVVDGWRIENDGNSTDLYDDGLLDWEDKKIWLPPYGTSDQWWETTQFDDNLLLSSDGDNPDEPGYYYIEESHGVAPKYDKGSAVGGSWSYGDPKINNDVYNQVSVNNNATRSDDKSLAMLIAEDLVPLAIRHVAGAIMLFWKETHPIAVTWESAPPPTMVSGQEYTVSWTITGATTLNHANVHWDPNDPIALTLLLTCPSELRCWTTSPNGTATGGSVTITAPNVSTPTVLKYVVHFRAVNGGENYYSDVVSVTINPAPTDTTPPTPNPMTWATQPYASSSTSIAMIATTAMDSQSPPVYYYFDFVDSPTGGTGGSDSGWQSSTSYTNSGLQPNHQYGYRVKARDSAPIPNETSYSSPTVYKYTLANAPGSSSFSNIIQTSIRANWTANSNRSGTQYFCENTTNGTNSGWITNTYWDSTGLTCGTSYTFRVKARNGDGVETVVWTNLGSQSTQACAAAGSLQFSSATYQVNENGGSAVITVTRTGGSNGVVGVTFSTSNGTATAGSDYTAVTQTVSFADGNTASKTVSIPIVDDSIYEGNETVNLTLSSPTGGATLGSPSTAVLTILENDSATRTLTVASSNPNSGVSITVSPNDNNGYGSGSTPFARTYNNGTSVTLTAPSTAGGNNFQKWQRNGVDYLTSLTISVTMDADYTMTAIYTSPVGVVTLATGLSNPNDIAIDDTSVYWTEYGSGTVKKVSKSGGSVITLVSGLYSVSGLAVDSNYVYFTENVGIGAANIKRISKSGGSVMTLASGQTSAWKVAVDGTSVYWTDGEGGTIHKVPINGGSVSTLATGSLSASGIVVDSTNVYWSEFTNPGSIKKVPLNGGSVTILANNSNTPGIAVDGTNVYWTEYVYTNSGKVNKVPVNGGSIISLATSLTSPWDVAVDGENVYWVEYTTGGAVKQISIGGGTPITLASGLDYPVAIAIDSTSVYWIERSNGASGTGTLKSVAKGTSIPDTTPPTAGTVTPSNTQYGSFVDSPFDLTTNFTDNESPVTSCEYTTNGNTWLSANLSGSSPTWTCTKTGITGTNGQVLTLNMRAISSGGTGTATAVTRTVDSAPPTTSDNSSSTWASTSPVTVILSPSDGAGSGVASTKYCVDTTNSCTPSISGTFVSVSCASGSECVQYVRYFSTDNVGNQETTKSSSQIRQDLKAPTNGTLGASSGNTQVSLDWTGFTDKGSGLRSTNTYKVVRNPGSYPDSKCTSGTQVYLGSGNSTTDIGLTNGTTYYYRACAYDNVENVSTGATASITPIAPEGISTPTNDTGIQGIERTDGGSDSNNLDTSTSKPKVDVEYNFGIILRDSTGDQPQYVRLYMTQRSNPTASEFYGVDLTCTGFWDAGATCTYSTLLGPAAVHKYYFEAKLADGTILRLPETGEITGPIVELLNGYNMVGAPRDITGANLDGNTAFGSQSTYRWVSEGLTTDSNKGHYEQVGTTNPLKPGEGYFAKRESNPTLPGLDVYLNILGENYSTVLKPGWNIITNTYGGNVKLSDLQVQKGNNTPVSWIEASANGWVVNAIYYYKGSDWGSTYTFESAGGSPDATLVPWMGYWIYLKKTDDTYYLVIPKP